ncbi:MAG: TetR/AcrR family transcriptional regulator [Acidobacteria bacterium]|nr:TetR/AcrR family transcriptional regulator [Acidobacteriota bacterium]
MGRPLEFDRCAVIAKAKEVFHRAGYEAASIEDLTEATGLSRASLYNSFGDKRGLLLATLDAACDEGTQIREQAAARKCGARKILKEFFAKLATMQGQGCYLLTLGSELSASDDEVKQRVEGALEEHRQMFAGILRREGGMTEKQVEVGAGALLGTMVAVLSLVRVKPEEALLEQVIQHGLKILD